MVAAMHHSQPTKKGARAPAGRLGLRKPCRTTEKSHLCHGIVSASAFLTLYSRELAPNFMMAPFLSCRGAPARSQMPSTLEPCAAEHTSCFTLSVEKTGDISKA